MLAGCPRCCCAPVAGAQAFVVPRRREPDQWPGERRGGAPGASPLSATGLAGLRRRDSTGEALPGLVLVGSHVPLADAQLQELLADGRCAGLELPVDRIARVLKGGTPDLLLADLEQEWDTL